jgi:hypothetical protein
MNVAQQSRAVRWWEWGPHSSNSTLVGDCLADAVCNHMLLPQMHMQYACTLQQRSGRLRALCVLTTKGAANAEHSMA